MRRMYLPTILLSFIGILSCNAPSNELEVSELEKYTTNNKVVIPRATVLEMVAQPENMVVSFKGDTLPYQLDDVDHDRQWDELTANLNMIEKPDDPLTNIQFGKSNRQGGPIKTDDAFTLYKNKLPRVAGYNLQMDGVAWENDVIGFRHYLDGRNGRDIFGKQISSMALDTVGLSDSLSQFDDYHVLEDWGRDILSVGNALGAGGLALIENGKLVRLGVTVKDEKDNVDSTVFKTVNEGPVRSIFSIDFYGWQVGERQIDLHQLVEIWPGDNYYTNRVWIESNKSADTLVVGLVNNNNDNPEILIDSLENQIIIATHDKQTYNKEYYLGMGVVFPKDRFIKYTTSDAYESNITDSFLLLGRMEPEEPLTFHFHAGWELQDQQFSKKRAYVDKLVKDFMD